MGPAGAPTFSTPPLQPATAPGGARVAPGFGFVVIEERASGGLRYVHVQDGRWLRASDVTPARPSTFAGLSIAPGEGLRVAWIIAPETTVRATPLASGPPTAVRRFHDRVTLSGPCRSGWCPLATGWIRATDLAVPAPPSRPTRVLPSERWLDIDLASQTLVAYRGDQPVYATLVSTGIGEPGSPLSTPAGLHTIRSKHELVRMDNLQHTGVVPYSYDVPLAQYFSDGKALHAALWHDRFGHPTSHGCINMAPRDAEWLFAFTDPAVSRYGSETYENAGRPGTILRIRGVLPAIALD